MDWLKKQSKIKHYAVSYATFVGFYRTEISVAYDCESWVNNYA
jgi:hypothetical protein